MKNDTRVIYKYVIPEGGKTTIRGWFTRVLDAAEQDGQLVLWAENSLTRSDLMGNQIPREDKEKIDLTIFSIGTGHPYSAVGVGEYLRSVQMSDGLVWHIFVQPSQDFCLL